jgi:hypothetical protein
LSLSQITADIFCDASISQAGPFVLFTPREGFVIEGAGDTQFITGAMPEPPAAGTLYLIVEGINSDPLDPKPVQQNGVNVAPSQLPEGTFPRFKYLISGPYAGTFDLVWPTLFPPIEPTPACDPYSTWASAAVAALNFKGSVL